MRLVLSIIIFLSVFTISIADAQLQLSLTQGVRGATPVAVLDFTGSKDAAAKLTTTIAHDLNNSGRLAAEHFSTQQSNADWRKAKINYTLSGSANCSGGRCAVDIVLDNVFSDNQRQLLDLDYHAKVGDLQQLAHTISDAVYKQLTGVRGVFNTRIAYVSRQGQGAQLKYNLVVADYDGANPQVLFSSLWPVMSPAWSPDGSSLAYVSFEGNRAAIYLQDLLTGARKKILSAPGINGAPAFSPDGAKMAIVESTSGNPKIYRYDLKTAKLSALTDGYSIDTEPSFSPDGKGIVFTSNRGGTPQIYYYDFASSNVKRITYAGPYNAHAEYLPDGKGLVYMHRSDFGWTIAYKDLSSGQLTELTDAGAAESPSIAPNGQMLIYATRFGRRGGLAEVSLDTKVHLRLPTAQGSVQEPAWSPYLT
jgi:TolB protein